MSFKFDERERKILIKSWKTPADQEKGKLLIDAVEPRIDVWIQMRNPNRLSLATIRDDVNEIVTKTDELLTAIRRYPNGVIALQGIDQKLSTAHDSGFEELRANLQKINGRGQQSITSCMEVLQPLLAVLSAEGNDVLRDFKLDVHRDISREIWLVSMLAQLYRMVFEKEPKKSKTSDFVEFVHQIATIVECEIGPSAIKNGIDEFMFLPPAKGNYIKRGDQPPTKI